MSFDGRSSSASSIDSTGSFESLQDPREMELQRLRTEISLLKKEVLDKRSEARELTNESTVTRTLQNECTLKSQISGEWKIVASRNVEEFLEKTEGSEVDDIVFQLADIHFQFDDPQKVTVFHKIGEKRYDEKDLSLDGPKWHSNGTCSTTYFTEKSMKIVDDGLAEQEISVKDGNLKIVERRGGVSCERTYERKMEDHVDYENENDRLIESIDIRKSIIGCWKFTGDPTVTVSFKVLESKVLFKWSGLDSYRVYELGVRHPQHRVMFTFKDNKLHGEDHSVFHDISHWVWFVENGELLNVSDCGMRLVFRRIGEPE